MTSRNVSTPFPPRLANLSVISVWLATKPQEGAIPVEKLLDRGRSDTCVALRVRKEDIEVRATEPVANLLARYKWPDVAFGELLCLSSQLRQVDFVGASKHHGPHILGDVAKANGGALFDQ